MHNANSILHQNKPSRESIICGQRGSWWIKQALIVLKIVLKSGQGAGELTRQFVNPKPLCAACLPPYPFAVAFYLQGMQCLMVLHGHFAAAA